MNQFIKRELSVLKLGRCIRFITFSIFLIFIGVGTTYASPGYDNGASLATKDIQQSNITIKGTVKDNTGETLPGVSVTEKGTTNGVATDIDGNYVIGVKSPNAILVFSYVGQEPKEIVVGSQRTIDVVLDEARSSDLDEVVVVGYGTQRKSSITGSIASVNVEKLKGITSPSIDNLLQGKLAGVSVTSSSGRPGSGSSIRVRGTGSIRASKDPLYVIDGVVGQSSSELNPNDIESISVLKDGSATALYGSRGANGVILISTKRGVKGISNLDVSARLGVSNLTKGNLRILDGAEHYQYANTSYANGGNTPSWFQPYLADQNFNWWDLSTQTALTQNYNVSYTHGGENSRSYISGDYYTEEGAIKGYDYNRFTFRVNNEWVVNKRLTLKTKISASYKETKDQEYSLNYSTVLPWDTPWNAQGQVKFVDGTTNTPSESEAPTADPRNYWYTRTGYNFLYNRPLTYTKSRNNSIDLGAGFDYKIFDFLTFESNNRFGFSNNYSDGYTDPKAGGQTYTKGQVSYGTNYTRRIYTSQLLRYLHTFGEKHEVNAFAGYDFDEYFNQTSSGYRNNIFPGGEVIDAGTGVYTTSTEEETAGRDASGNKTVAKNAALFLNANYSYDSKYLFQASIRRDGASRFGPNSRWATFWSLGAGWNMHDEDFIKNLGFVNQLKPRVSYGTTGNLPGGAYDWLTLYGLAEYAGNLAFLSNYAGNPDLIWEKTNSLNAGFDARLFNRVSIIFDFYNKNVTNLIYLKSMSAVSGFNRQTANDGKMRNQGFELTVTPEIIRTKDLSWDVTFNVGYNNNKITYMPEQNIDNNHIQDTGLPYGSWHLIEWAGVDPITGSGMWFNVAEDGTKTATTDPNEGTPVTLDKTSLPKYTGGISSSLSWKNLSMNVNFTFSQGASIYNSDRASALDRDGLDPTQPAMKLANGWSRWEKPGDIATHPKLSTATEGSGLASSRWLESGDYFKLKSLSISYSLPKKLLASLGIKSASVTVGGENLFTITKFSGYDPEIYLSDDNGFASVGYPTVRRFTMGVNLKF